MELAKQLVAYKVMRRTIKPIIKQYRQLKTGIQEEEQTLKLLYQDVKQGRGERHRFDEFIKFEHNKVEQLAALSTDYLRAKAQLFDDYYRLYPSVNALDDYAVGFRRYVDLAIDDITFRPCGPTISSTINNTGINANLCAGENGSFNLSSTVSSGVKAA